MLTIFSHHQKSTKTYSPKIKLSNSLLIMSFNTNITFDCPNLCPLWAIKVNKTGSIVRCECYGNCSQKSIYVCLQCGNRGTDRYWPGNHLKSTRAHQLMDGQIIQLNIINLKQFHNVESRKRNGASLDSNTLQPAISTNFIPAMESDFCTVIDNSSSPQKSSGAQKIMIYPGSEP